LKRFSEEDLPMIDQFLMSSKWFRALLFCGLILFYLWQAAAAELVPNKIVLVIHGGAGTILKEKMTPAGEQEYRGKLEEALNAGYAILKKGGSSLDAVEASIQILENSPLFNAGKGAVFGDDGSNQLDASIMDGKTLKAGAASGLRHIKNPISLVRLIMEKSPHVMMSGVGAEIFAQMQGVEMVPEEYFFTQPRWEEFQKIKEKEKSQLREGKNSSALSDPPLTPGTLLSIELPNKFGTVGAVALDLAGNLAAGTSTGGMPNKKYGRIGDSPIIGAGTYANNKTCAVSSTGYGEYFIRTVVAHDISALMEYKGLSVGDASRLVIEKVAQLGGSGGVIALDGKGNFAMPFNTPGMYRGYISGDGQAVVEIYK
jgi:L-asparaginase / beta-aspartyl-peptidase